MESVVGASYGSEIFGLVFFMFVPVIWIGPVGMGMSGSLMFVPVTVINGPRHAGEDVIVMSVVVAMPVLMGGGFMVMDMSRPQLSRT